MKSISDNDYKNVQKVWNTIDKKNLGYYHDAYFKTDVLLLANVFETFRNECLKHYKLDPAHFCKAHGFVGGLLKQWSTMPRPTIRI